MFKKFLSTPTVFLCLILFTTSYGFSQHQEVIRFKTQRATTDEDLLLKQQFKAYTLATLGTEQVSNLLHSKEYFPQLQLEVNGEIYSFSLRAKDVRAPNYKLRAWTDQGIVSLPRSPNKTYSGFTNDGAHDVRITADTNFFFGLIAQDHDELYIEPARHLIPGTAKNKFVIYWGNDNLKKFGEESCGVHDAHTSYNAEDNSVNETPEQEFSGRVCKVVQIALADDHLMFNTYGSITDVENHNMAVINNVETNYDFEFNVDLQFSIVEIFVATSAGNDPWSTSTDPQVLLNSFTNWGPNGFDNTHDVAGLWSDRNFDDDVVGLAWGPGLATEGGSGRAWPTETGATLGQYTLRKGSARRDATGSAPPLRVGGVVFRRDMAGAKIADRAGVRPYWLLGTAGSITAEYAGYAELLGGLGLRYPLPFYPPLALRAEVAVGSGGGGTALDTAGGLLGKAGVGLSWQAGRHWGVTALAGLTESRGRFSAQEARVELVWRGWDVVPGEARAPEPPGAALAWKPWTASAGWAQYTATRRADGSDPGLGVVTLKLEREIGPHWRLTGQAGIASNGRAGGYATGQLGLGWLGSAVFDPRWRFGAEASLGAAGGGAVDVGDGMIAQVQGVARYAVTPGWALQLDAGWLRSRQGAVSTPFIGLSSVVSFSRLQAP